MAQCRLTERIIVVLALLLVPSAAHAQQSHLAQSIATHVTLSRSIDSFLEYCTGEGSQPDNPFFRTLPDGRLQAFSIAPENVLVVTDVSWMASSSGPFSVSQSAVAGTNLFIEVRLENDTTIPPVFRSKTVSVGLEGPPTAGTEHLTAGFVVGAEAPDGICTVLYTSSASGSGGKRVLGIFPLEIVLHGYLMPAPQGTDLQLAGDEPVFR